MLTSSNLRDVVVVGAGPAGSMTARRLAEQGHDVLLLEEHEAIGAPVHCTGLMGAEAFAATRLKDLVTRAHPLARR